MAFSLSCGIVIQCKKQTSWCKKSTSIGIMITYKNRWFFKSPKKFGTLENKNHVAIDITSHTKISASLLASHVPPPNFFADDPGEVPHIAAHLAKAGGAIREQHLWGILPQFHPSRRLLAIHFVSSRSATCTWGELPRKLYSDLDVAPKTAFFGLFLSSHIQGKSSGRGSVKMVTARVSRHPWFPYYAQRIYDRK